MTTAMRDRVTDAIRVELAEKAFDVIVERGWDDVTADELARAIGVSRATFFRYFGSKEEVVVAGVEGPRESYTTALDAAATATAPSRWDALQLAFEPAVSLSETDAPRLRARIRLIQSQPALGARLARARHGQLLALSRAMAPHVPDRFSADVVAAVGVAVLDSAWAEWARTDHASLREILHRGFDIVRSAHAPEPESSGT